MMTNLSHRWPTLILVALAGMNFRAGPTAQAQSAHTKLDQARAALRGEVSRSDSRHLAHQRGRSDRPNLVAVSRRDVR